jgi:toxin ParE1/3/4
MATVIWNDQALDDLDVIVAYIARDAPRAAERFAEQAIQRTVQLEAFPYSGRIVPEFGREDIREVLFGRYRIVYQIRGDIVGIVTIHHGARRLSDLIMPDEP